MAIIASSSTVLFALVCYLLYNSFAFSASNPYSPSSVASDQLQFWSRNVRNNMPKAVLSQLSPMSKRDSYYFSSLLSQKSFEKSADFCSIAQLACSVDTYEPYVAKESRVSGLNSYKPYAEKKSRPSGLDSYNPYVVKESHPWGLNSYKPYAEKESRPSGLNKYKPYVAEESRPSGVNSYKPYFAKGSTDPKTNKYYYPYVAKTSRGANLEKYLPYVRDSKKTKLSSYVPYVATESAKSELLKYKPYVYRPYVESESSAKYELNKYKAYAEHPSHDSVSVDPHIFFRLSTLERGNKVLLPSSLSSKLPDRALLPIEIAKKFSMRPEELKRIFPTSFVSPLTRDAILTTLSYCTAQEMKGDTKSCLNSLEDMIRFSQSILGKRVLVALTTESENGSGKELMIENIKQIEVQKYVACHQLFLPFATHFCHFLESTRLYRVDFVDSETKTPVNKVLAMCHMETSNFPADHISLEALKLSPGQGEVCHWLTPTEIVWIGDKDYKG